MLLITINRFLLTTYNLYNLFNRYLRFFQIKLIKLIICILTNYILNAQKNKLNLCTFEIVKP